MSIVQEILDAKLEWTPPPVEERAKKVVEHFYKAEPHSSLTPNARTLLISTDYRKLLCDLILELVDKIEQNK